MQRKGVMGEGSKKEKIVRNRTQILLESSPPLNSNLHLGYNNSKRNESRYSATYRSSQQC